MQKTFYRAQNSSSCFPIGPWLLFSFSLPHFLNFSLSYFHFHIFTFSKTQNSTPFFALAAACCTANTFLPNCKPFSNHFPTICKPHNEGATNPPNHIIGHPTHHFCIVHHISNATIFIANAIIFIANAIILIAKAIIFIANEIIFIANATIVIAILPAIFIIIITTTLMTAYQVHSGNQ